MDGIEQHDDVRRRGDAAVSYQYDSSKAERKAAELLREKGWDVSEPKCPECNGWGQRTVFVEGSDIGLSSGFAYESCSLGCSAPNLYLGMGGMYRLSPDELKALSSSAGKVTLS
jgi:hypothetical protein